ncbi:ferrous iron transport protein B [Enterococcus saccharolyticus]|uniref:ferrous iron transport protein B n=1 Tax=Enterococcus TaxID=1350 RepID=UPI001E35C8E6|nr:ferrous iron transport protein B [Enterococcus saccharolyticus]MCD5003653.1 ferrous iron transport protein B [Enterococcus saccharolyticus]
MSSYHFALAGNPNSGKTTVFNYLTGSSQRVGNWPGVTIERKSGYYRKNKQIILQDLPGTYSLSPYTPEEIITREYLLEQQPDVILNIVDGSNLERNLYLTTQLLEIGLPIVIGVNMMDIVKKSGRKLNLEKLSYSLGVPIVGMSALKKKGLDTLVDKGSSVTNEHVSPLPIYDSRIESALHEIITVLESSISPKKARWYAIKLFEKDSIIQETLALNKSQEKEIAEIIQIVEMLFDDTSDAILINERYEFISRLLSLCMIQQQEFKATVSDKIDRIVTNRFLALPIFAIILWGVYYLSIQTLGTLGTDWINEELFGKLIPELTQNVLVAWSIAPWLQALILDGIIAGVGAVLGFLPQILVLFFCLSILEDCGYMSRIAFVMDRIFRKFGLSGKSFIPMLIATGCGVPGVMASRTIENEQDRRLTVMVTTFMPCSAKLPIIALIAGAFFPTSSWIAPSAYFVGVIAIVLSGIALKKTVLFGGDPSPFIMELPAYHFPQLKNVCQQTFSRGISFVKKAGTIIFVSCIFIWFTLHYNFMLQPVEQQQSILVSIGKLVAPLFAPLGWGNWQGTVAMITGLVAKENVLGTFGVLYSNLNTVSDNGKEVWQLLHNDFTSLSAYSFLLFNLLCAPCFAAMGAIHREMADRKWTGIAISYQCGLAYLVSFVFYQLGQVLIESAPISLGTLIALFVLFGMIYSILRKQKNSVQSSQIAIFQGGK